jgi:hypothetical protein
VVLEVLLRRRKGKEQLVTHQLRWQHDENTMVYHTAGEHGRYIAFRAKDPTSHYNGPYMLRHRAAPQEVWMVLGTYNTFEAVKSAADLHEHAMSQ